jgi:hypothetical protein
MRNKNEKWEMGEKGVAKEGKRNERSRATDGFR